MVSTSIFNLPEVDVSGSYIRSTAKAHLDVNLCGNISAAWGPLANHYRSFSGGRSKMMIFINQDNSKTPQNTTSDPCLTRIWNGCWMPCRMHTISSILPHLQSLSVHFAFHQNNMHLSSFVYGCLWFPWGPERLGLVHSNRAEVSPYFWLLGQRTVLRPLVGWSVCIDRLKLFKEGSEYDQIMIRLWSDWYVESVIQFMWPSTKLRKTCCLFLGITPAAACPSVQMPQGGCRVRTQIEIIAWLIWINMD